MFWFTSINQPNCFHANTMQFLLLLLCSTIWNQRWWNLQKFLYFYCTGFFLALLFYFLYEIEYYSFKCVKNYVGNFMGIVLNLKITFGEMALFIMFILLIPEHRISFHLLISFPSFFLQKLRFLSYRSFTSSRYFMFLCSDCEGFITMI